MKSVFISYSTKEAKEVEAIRNILETNGISCWIAPRDIPGGSHYAREIPGAIRSCKIFLLILSRNAQSSIWVSRELDQAVSSRKVILPLMLEDFPLNDEFNFYLTGAQRLEAFQQKSRCMENLIEQIHRILGTTPPTRSQHIGNIGTAEDFSKEPMLRLDGLYCFPSTSSTSYLRFFSDGTVISVSSTGTPQQISSWFKYSYECRGHYIRSGNQILFGVAYPGKPSVDYSGTVEYDQLTLHIHSNINGYRSTEVYKFTPDI